jgi:hypothetical protein
VQLVSAAGAYGSMRVAVNLINHDCRHPAALL